MPPSMRSTNVERVSYNNGRDTTITSMQPIINFNGPVNFGSVYSFRDIYSGEVNGIAGGENNMDMNANNMAGNYEEAQQVKTGPMVEVKIKVDLKTKKHHRIFRDKRKKTSILRSQQFWKLYVPEKIICAGTIEFKAKFEANKYRLFYRTTRKRGFKLAEPAVLKGSVRET